MGFHLARGHDAKACIVEAMDVVAFGILTIIVENANRSDLQPFVFVNTFGAGFVEEGLFHREMLRIYSEYYFPDRIVGT